MAKAAIGIVALVAAFAGIGACGHAGPGPLGAIGAPCRTDYDCGGLFCVDPGGGTCQAACRSNVDCGPGFHCHNENRRGTGGKVDVCVPN